MEGPRNELLGWLKPNGDDEKELPLKVVSILGVEGVGKSTLA
jgi:signal recognition particle GTPase